MTQAPTGSVVKVNTKIVADIEVCVGEVKVTIGSTGISLGDAPDLGNHVHIDSAEIDNLMVALKSAIDRYESAVQP